LPCRAAFTDTGRITSHPELIHNGPATHRSLPHHSNEQKRIARREPITIFCSRLVSLGFPYTRAPMMATGPRRHRHSAASNRLRSSIRSVAPLRRARMSTGERARDQPQAGPRRGGCATALLAVWYVATDKEIGRRIAESRLFSDRGRSVILIAAFLLLPVLLPVPKQVISWSSSALVLVVLLTVGARTAAWGARHRWAGSLVLDLNRSRKRRFLAALGVMAAGICVSLFTARPEIDDPVLVFCLALAGTHYLDGRLEIRERGIVYAGRLLAWGSIESCQWATDEAQRVGWLYPVMHDDPVLKVYLRRVLKALPPVRILIPPGRREEADAVLSRYLGEWPAEAPQKRNPYSLF
jgi:hypothetical protein